MLPPPHEIGEPACAPLDPDWSREAAMGRIIDSIREMDDVALKATDILVPGLLSHARDSRKAVVNGIEIEPHPDHHLTNVINRTVNDALEEIGNRHGIFDLAQDNGLRVLTIKLLMNLGICAARGGNDLFDASGTEYELKTLNLDKEQLSITTSHHLGHATIDRYRKVGFIIGTYRRGSLVSLYIVHPAALEEQFARWEASLVAGKSHLNNPSISIATVRDCGVLVYGEPLRKRNVKKSKSQLEMDGVAPEIHPRTTTLNSLEEGMAASFARYQEHSMAKERKAVEVERKRAIKAAQIQCELPLA